MSVTTQEPQNQSQFESYLKEGGVQLGPWTSHIWRDDPRHLGFLLSRYKFCAKMLEGRRYVMEVGCGDALGLAVVKQTVHAIHGIDLEPLVVEDATRRLQLQPDDAVSLSVHDMTRMPLDRDFDAAYSLDVIEHVPSHLEEAFMANVCGSMVNQSVCILGTPNVEAKRFASPLAAEGHINLKSAESLRSLLEKYFRHVFLFSMNDEVVHTGFYPMAHYLFGMGVEKR